MFSSEMDVIEDSESIRRILNICRELFDYR